MPRGTADVHFQSLGSSRSYAVGCKAGGGMGQRLRQPATAVCGPDGNENKQLVKMGRNETWTVDVYVRGQEESLMLAG